MGEIKIKNILDGLFSKISIDKQKELINLVGLISNRARAWNYKSWIKNPNEEGRAIVLSFLGYLNRYDKRDWQEVNETDFEEFYNYLRRNKR